MTVTMERFCNVADHRGERLTLKAHAAIHPARVIDLSLFAEASKRWKVLY